MSPGGPRLSAETLSRIMLLQGMMGQLPDERRICEFIAHGLVDLPGVRAVRYEPDPAAIVASPGDLLLAVELSLERHGAFVVSLAEPRLFAPYEAHVRNLCFMVAVVLQERRQRAEIVAHQRTLELRVEARTRELAAEMAVRQEAQRQAVAERQRAEEYLTIAEVVIVELDAEACIQRVNPRGCALLGRPLDQLVGRNWFDVAIPVEERDFVRDVFTRIMAGDVAGAEYHDNDIVDAKGRRYHIAWHNVYRCGEDGRCVGTLSSGLDVTERELAERGLAAEKENLAVTLRSIGDAVITTDIHGNVVLMNTVAEHLTGTTQSEAAGNPLSSCFHVVNEQTRAPAGSPVERALASNRVVELEDRTILIARDGREYAIADSGAPIRASDGSVRGVVLVFRDMTEERRMMEVVQRTDRLEALGVLAGGIAHDFNNLLGGIYGYVELAQLDTTEPAVLEELASAAATIERARGLTRQLLTFAKGGAPVRRVVALLPVIRENVRFALSGTNVSHGLDLPDDLWNCTVDVGQIGQVIDNLIINAVQAMPTGGTIAIAARNVSLAHGEIPTLAAGPHVRVEIRDSGVGIPPAQLTRIFDPFFSTKKTGSGLGLATAFSIVARHGGTMMVESQRGLGATFTFYLPAAPLLSPSPVTTEHHVHHVGRGSLLVMDDEGAILEVATKLLSSVGYRVLAARDGQEAIDLFVRAAEGDNDIAAVILDLTVPGGMGGKEAAATIRRCDPAVPILVMSGYAQDPVMAAPRDYGFTDFLRKPFTRSELLGMLEKHC